MFADPGVRATGILAGRGVYLLDDHEVVRRGLRHLLEPHGLSVVGESGSAREAVRRIPAVRPDLAILDDELPDGSGVDVCRAIAAAEPGIRCVLMTGECDEAVLIASILASAWGCLSKQDDSVEQLRLICRVLEGHTAYSGRFHPALIAPIARRGPAERDVRLLRLSKQEMTVAVGLGRGLSNRQISQELFLAEKTVKNTVSSILMKLGMGGRTQVAVLMSTALGHPDDPANGGYRFSRFTDLIAEVTAALLHCTSEVPTMPLTIKELAANADRLADALTATRTGLPVLRPQPPRI